MSIVRSLVWGDTEKSNFVCRTAMKDAVKDDPVRLPQDKHAPSLAVINVYADGKWEQASPTIFFL